MQVRPIAEDEMFKVMRSGKRQKKQWKRMLTKVTFVGGGFTRKPPKYERFIRPTGMFGQRPASEMRSPAASAAASTKRHCLQAGQASVTYAFRATGLRMNKAHVTHPELKCTFCLGIIGVKKNPNGQTYTSLGVMTKGTIIEVRTGPLACRLLHPVGVRCSRSSQMLAASCLSIFLHFRQVNVSELGLVTPGGKVVWGKYAQVRCRDVSKYASKPVGCCMAASLWELVPV
jgi:ribosome biogenesis protein NSA2